MAAFAVDGSINITVTDGTTRTGLYAPDGSIYVVVADGTVPVGVHHPSGAWWVTTAPSGVVAYNAPDGSIYISESPYTTGGRRVTIVSGSVGAGFTWNPNDKHVDVVLSNGNLTASKPADTSLTGYSNVRATAGKSTGKWHFEITADSYLPTPGVANATAGLETYPGEDNNSVGVFPGTPDGAIFLGGVAVKDFIVTESPTVYAIEIDATARLFWVSGDGRNWNEDPTADPATGVGGVNISAITGELFPVVSLYNPPPQSDIATLNLGASAFTRTVSSGFTAWDGGDETGPDLEEGNYLLLASGSSILLLANGTDRLLLSGTPFDQDQLLLADGTSLLLLANGTDKLYLSSEVYLLDEDGLNILDESDTQIRQ